MSWRWFILDFIPGKRELSAHYRHAIRAIAYQDAMHKPLVLLTHIVVLLFFLISFIIAWNMNLSGPLPTQVVAFFISWLAMVFVGRFTMTGCFKSAEDKVSKLMCPDCGRLFKDTFNSDIHFPCCVDAMTKRATRQWCPSCKCTSMTFNEPTEQCELCGTELELIEGDDL